MGKPLINLNAIKKTMEKTLLKKNDEIAEEIVKDDMTEIKEKSSKKNINLEDVLLAEKPDNNDSFKSLNSKLIDIKKDDMQKAFIYSEIFGAPKCRTRGGKRRCSKC